MYGRYVAMAFHAAIVDHFNISISLLNFKKINIRNFGFT